MQCSAPSRFRRSSQRRAALSPRIVAFSFASASMSAMWWSGEAICSVMAVNVAAHLEGLAEPGGIAISGAAHGYVRKALPLTYVDLGEQHVKNIDEPIRTYAIKITEPAATRPSRNEAKPLPLPDKPSIAVLPFTNMSGDS